jgi:serine/threonine protein kinase
MLIDLEMACQVGDQKPIGIGDGTPSYTSPEQLASKHPVLADDYFSLGGIIFFLATLRDPFFPQDDPAIRPNQERMQKYYSLFAREWDLPQCLETAIRLSRASSPTDRLSASDVRQLLRKEGWNLRNRHTPMVGSLIAMPALSEAAFANAQDRASSAVSYIADSFNFASSERPMPSTCLGDSSHACNIQHGAAGVGLALLAHFKINSNKRHEKSLLELARWIRRYIRQNPEGPSGLYFGTAGVAWFLLSVADLLEEGELKEASVNLARKLPKESDLSDVTHGGAGIGLALLHFFHQTGDPQFIVEACQLGDYLRSTFGSDSPSGLLWSRTKIQPSGLDLKEVSYGFAHGGAGIGYFFLCLHLSVVGVPFATPATSDASSYRTAYLDIAMQTASNLLASSVERDSALYWPHGPSRQTLWPHWCNGSSGVGSFLIRLAAAVGDTQMEHEAIRASHAVLRERWASAAGQCHGLAGNAEFLLDLYQFTGQERFLQEAFYLGDLIELHKIIRPSGTTYPDDTGMATGLDYSIGSAGVATFFSRLAGRQERLLMLDYLLPSSTRGIKTTAGAEAHATVVSK